MSHVTNTVCSNNFHIYRSDWCLWAIACTDTALHGLLDGAFLKLVLHSVTTAALVALFKTISQERHVGYIL